MRVAVVAGFQGVSDTDRTTTLGRGGSDTTAVAFAAAFDAIRCDIYTDVDGIYTTDPRITEKAKKLNKIGIKAFKIGSGECNNIPLLEKIAEFKTLLFNDFPFYENILKIVERKGYFN